MNIKFTPRAQSEAEAKTKWWRKNRQASADLFDDELAEVLAAIQRDPTIGAVHRSKHSAIVRKRLMPRTKNHVYFAIHEGIILIVSVWGFSGGLKLIRSGSGREIQSATS